MLKTQHLSLIFTGLIFLLVLFGNINYGARESEWPTLQESVNSTALSESAQVIPGPFPQLIAVPPTVSAEAVLVLEVKSGKKLLDKNSYKQWPIASLTKLMTAVIALEKIGPDKIIVIDERAVSAEGIAGGWQIGNRASVQELIETMMLVSSNDAAMALANFYGYEVFVNAMREKANALGMKNMTFADPMGLSLLNQSSLEDMAKLAVYVYETHSEILAWSRQPEIEILDRKLLNINKFANRPDWLGGKTGFIDESGGNLISFFEYNNQPILIIIFGAQDRFVETEVIYNWVKSFL